MFWTEIFPSPSNESAMRRSMAATLSWPGPAGLHCEKWCTSGRASMSQSFRFTLKNGRWDCRGSADLTIRTAIQLYRLTPELLGILRWTTHPGLLPLDSRQGSDDLPPDSRCFKRFLLDAQSRNRPADDQLLDLLGAFEDVVDLGITVPALDRVLAGVAVAAEDLDGSFGHPRRGAAGL